MKIEIVPVKELSAEDYKKCDSLNMRHNGMMQRTFRFIRTGMSRYPWYFHIKSKPDDVTPTVFMIKEGDTLLSWALMFSKYGKIETYFYTRRNARRKGLGVKLAETVDEHLNGSPYTVIPWDPTSRRFFNRLEETGINIRQSPW